MTTLLFSSFKQIVDYLQENIFTKWLLEASIMLLICLIIILIGVILFYLFRKTKQAERKIIFQNTFNNLVGQIAICETEDELLEVFLRSDHQKILHEFQKGKSQRNLFIHELAETSKKFRGSTLKNILWMFEKMSLEKELLINLSDHKWYKRANAIQQMAYLQQKNSIKDLFALTNHENELLRMEAQIAIVKLTGFKGLKFLNEIIYPISEWQQLRLIEELSGQVPENLSNISEWLKSKNESVLNFSLRLVEIYRQYNCYDQVLGLLSHPSILICKNTLITLSHIINETTIDFLVKYYHNYHPELQFQILKIIQIHGNQEQLEFLISLLNDDNNCVKLEAAKAIFNIDSAGIEKIKELVNQNSFPWTTILPQLKLQNI